MRRTLVFRWWWFSKDINRVLNSPRRALTPPQELLRDSVGSWVVYWMDRPSVEERYGSMADTRLGLVAERLGGIRLDEDDMAGFVALFKTWGDDASLAKSAH